MIFLLQEDMCMQPKEALFKRFCFLAVQICLNLLLAKLKKLYDIEDLAWDEEEEVCVCACVHIYMCAHECGKKYAY